MALVRLSQSLIRRLHRSLPLPPPPPTDHHAAVARSLALSHANTCVRGFANLWYNAGCVIGHKFRGSSPVHVVKVLEPVAHLDHARPLSTAAPAAASSQVPVGARKVGLKVVMMSPGFVYKSYSLWEPSPFGKNGLHQVAGEEQRRILFWRLRKKAGYTKKQFYDQALKIYKEVNTLITNGDIISPKNSNGENAFCKLSP